MEIPRAYAGREQTFLKHLALWEHETQWAVKVGQRASKLWHVDGFAGPWKSRDESFRDTSFYRGIEALKYARKARGCGFRVGAVLVEENPGSFAELEALRSQLSREGVDLHLLPGRFQDHVGNINYLVGGDPAFVFIDPTGWKGAGMRFVAAVAHGWRDVLIRVPSESHRLGAIAPHVDDFFGVAIPSGLSSDETIALYRNQLKAQAGLNFAADMIVPSPTRDSIACWLVIGGNHQKVVEVFRGVEAKVVGGIAAEVRGRAKAAKELERTRQLSMFGRPLPKIDAIYESKRKLGIQAVRSEIMRAIADFPQRVDSLWPTLLEDHHVTKRDVCQVALGLVQSGAALDPRREKEQTIKDHHVLSRRPLAATRPRKEARCDRIGHALD